MSIQARAHAARGDAAACARALGQANEHFSAIDPATALPWGAYVGATGISSFQGAAHYALAPDWARPGRRRAGGAAAAPCRGPLRSRLRPVPAQRLPDLAGAHAIAGDVDTAVIVGHQASTRSQRYPLPGAYDRLRVLNTVLEPLHASAGVAELRGRLTATAA